MGSLAADGTQSCAGIPKGSIVKKVMGTSSNLPEINKNVSGKVTSSWWLIVFQNEMFS